MSSTFDGSSPAASNSSPLAGYGTVDQGLLLPANVPLSAETCQVIKKKNKKHPLGNSPGGLVVRTQHLHCHGLRFDP